MTTNILIIYEKIIKQYFWAVEIAAKTEDLTPISKIHKNVIPIIPVLENSWDLHDS